MKAAAALALLCLLVFLSSTEAQGLRPGDIVNTNFGFVNRYRWTNETTDQVIPAGNVFRLREFDGKIVFFVFFDVW